MLPERPDGTTMLSDPPALHDREAELEQFLLAALAGYGDDDARQQYVDTAVEILSITHSLIGKRDRRSTCRRDGDNSGRSDRLTVGATTARLGQECSGKCHRVPRARYWATLRDRCRNRWHEKRG